MSEPLYRLATNEEFDNWSDGIIEIFAMPIEPCVHGRIDGHMKPNGAWCPGAGIGGN